jgi:hypothetical protein
VAEKKNVLSAIREREMDRKSFLKMSGLVLLSLVGAKAIVALLSPDSMRSLGNKTEESRGFGSGKYGA